MDEKVKKSILIEVDKVLWRRFKSKVALRDKRIGELVIGWIKGYVGEEEGKS